MITVRLKPEHYVRLSDQSKSRQLCRTWRAYEKPIRLFSVPHGRVRRSVPGRLAQARRARTAAGRAPVKDFRPVTEAMLRNPAPGDWLNWRRTDNAWGYSPLDQINRQNVQQLQLAWSWAMDDTGAQEATPLVYDGIMYLPNPRGVIQALDAATGDLIWEYRPEVKDAAAPAPRRRRRRTDRDPAPRPAAPRAAAAIPAEGFSETSRSSATRSSAPPTTRTSSPWTRGPASWSWDTTVADSKLGYGYTSGPIVVRGKVIAGITGCSRYKDDVCFITGHDAATGKELWRTSTIARPGEPGGDTWGDLPLHVPRRQRRVDPGQLRSGREPGLLGHRAGQAVGASGPRHRRRRALHELDARARSRHRKDEVVLPAPARRDAGHGRSVREHPDRHRRTQVAVQDGQAGHSLAARSHDRRVHSARRISATRTIVEVNPQTGKVTYRPGMIPQIGVEVDHVSEHRRIQELARDGIQPADQRAVHPAESELREGDVRPRSEKVVGGGGTGPVRRTRLQASGVGRQPRRIPGHGRPVRARSCGGIARLRRPTRPRSTTAGGLVFGGDWDRHMYAYDAATGRSSGRPACRPPRRDFRSPIWPKGNSTWPCRRGLAAAAGRR